MFMFIALCTYQSARSMGYMVVGLVAVGKYSKTHTQSPSCRHINIIDITECSCWRCTSIKCAFEHVPNSGCRSVGLS